jgi:hypothetical protein
MRHADVALAATLYLPRSNGAHPAIVLIPGSGPFNRAQYRGFAEFFARQGIAALIYDKRSLGAPNGTGLVSFNDLTEDAQAAVQLLKGRSDINADQIGLWGGSEGAGVAAAVAAQANDVAFLVSVSGGGVTYAELVMYQLANRLRAQGYSEAEVAAALAVVRQLHEFVRTGNDGAALQNALDEAWRHRWAEGAVPRTIPSAAERAAAPEWRELDGDPAQMWAQVKVPVLAFWGERDELVPVAQSVARISAALRRAGNQHVTIKIIAGADHNLNRATGPSTDAEYLKTMVDWIWQTVKQPQ